MRYDDVIIGGGTSGSVLAARLSEDPNRLVMMLEAGPDYTTVEALPSDIRDPFAVSVVDHDWHFTAEAVPGRMIDYARGKVTGGCSAINGTIALRGIPADYDEWAALGNPDWAWEKCLPYFNRIEDDQDESGPFHGKGGPIPIVRWKTEELISVQQAFVAACQGQGIPYTPDHNHPQSTGVGPIPMNRRGDVRISSAVGYLNPARYRLNLTVRPHCNVHRILFEGKKAVGVEVEHEGKIQQVYGDNVILSAGAVNSPAILLRSGVGPAADLKKLGIDVVLDRAGVGEHLIEHQLIFVGLVPKAGIARPENPDVQTVVSYTAAGSKQFNDMQIYMVNKFGAERGGELMKSYSGPPLITAVMSVLNRALSTGTVTLQNTDPDTQPRIQINSYSDAEDMRRMVEGVRVCWEIAHSAQMQEVSSETVFPDPATIDNDARLKKYVIDNSATIWHPVGTCKMGPSRDASAVVDQHFRAHGLQNLRIVDASVMANVPSRNPNLTCMVFGERAAEWIAQGV